MLPSVINPVRSHDPNSISPGVVSIPSGKTAHEPSIVSVRRANLADSKAVHALLSDRHIAHWTAELSLVTMETIQDTIRAQSNQNFILVACVNTEVAGVLTLSLYEKPRLRHVGRLSQLAVHQNYRGRGVGAELVRSSIELADSWLNLIRLELLVYTDNEPAIRLYQKLGFESEGVLRRIAFRASQYVDCLLMARINDWGTFG